MMNYDDEDAGYTAGQELRVDAEEMNSLLCLIYNFFTHTANRRSRESLKEAMLDGLGYIYFARKRWRRSTLLMSLEPDFKQGVGSNRAGEVVQEFIAVAEEPLTEIIDAFVNHKLRR